MSRKKPGLAFWATVGLVVALLYVASIGPVARIVMREDPPDWEWTAFTTVYYPIHRINRSSKTARSISGRYMDLWGVKRPN